MRTLGYLLNLPSNRDLPYNPPLHSRRLGLAKAVAKNLHGLIKPLAKRRIDKLLLKSNVRRRFRRRPSRRFLVRIKKVLGFGPRSKTNRLRYEVLDL